MTLRDGRGEPDRGLAAAATFRGRFHGDARQPGRQDVLGNLANAYGLTGRLEQAARLRREVYFGLCKVEGADCPRALKSATNYAISLAALGSFEEVKALLRQTVPMARRVLGESDERTIKMMSLYAQALYADDGATLDDLREAVTTLEVTARIGRRVLGGKHPLMEAIEPDLRNARAALGARETPPGSA